MTRYHVKRKSSANARELGVTVATAATLEEAIAICSQMQADDPAHFYGVYG